MDITSLFDISDIHHYSFNGKRMVFLHSRQQKLHVRLVDVAYKCESCGYELVDSSKFYSTKQRDSIKFCSMACKVRFFFFFSIIFQYSVLIWFVLISFSSLVHLIWLQVTNMMISKVDHVYENELPSSLTINRSDGPHQYYRKRSRKGTPIRSPFF